jgi:hypothetical protein
MRCREFEDRINDLLDQRLPPERDALLLRHAGECHSCHELLAGQATLLAGVELLETPPLSTNFAAAVLTQSREIPVALEMNTPRSGKRNWLGILAGLVSLAAVVLLAVWIGMSRQENPARPIAVNPARPIAVKPASPAAPKKVEVAKDSTPPKQSAPTSIANAVAPPPVAAKEEYQEYRDAINSLTAQLPSAVEKIDEVQQSTPAIRPLRASFSMAIGTLQRTIPSRATKRDTRPTKPDSGFLYSHQRDVVV